MTEFPAQRDLNEVSEELAALKDAHLQNESARDAFLAIAHTALFAASVAFVGDVAGTASPKIIWVLILGWSVSVVGLCALALSYFVTTTHIRRRHEQVYEPVVDEPLLANAMNSVALWSFPLALISTFAFAAVNVRAMSKEPQEPPQPSLPITRGVTPPPRHPNPGFGVTPAPRAPAPPRPAPAPPATPKK